MSATEPMVAVLRANPFMFFFAIAAVAAAALFLGYRAYDSLALPSTQHRATIVAKKFYPRGENEIATIVGGRPWLQRQETAEIHLLTLTIDGMQQFAVVPKARFDALAPGDAVIATVQRTRLSGSTYVVDVRAKAN